MKKEKGKYLLVAIVWLQLEWVAVSQLKLKGNDVSVYSVIYQCRTAISGHSEIVMVPLARTIIVIHYTTQAGDCQSVFLLLSLGQTG